MLPQVFLGILYPRRRHNMFLFVGAPKNFRYYSVVCWARPTGRKWLNVFRYLRVPTYFRQKSCITYSGYSGHVCHNFHHNGIWHITLEVLKGPWCSPCKWQGFLQIQVAGRKMKGPKIFGKNPHTSCNMAPTHVLVPPFQCLSLLDAVQDCRCEDSAWECGSLTCDRCRMVQKPSSNSKAVHWWKLEPFPVIWKQNWTPGTEAFSRNQNRTCLLTQRRASPEEPPESETGSARAIPFGHA